MGGSLQGKINAHVLLLDARLWSRCTKPMNPTFFHFHAPFFHYETPDSTKKNKTNKLLLTSASLLFYCLTPNHKQYISTESIKILFPHPLLLVRSKIVYLSVSHGLTQQILKTLETIRYTDRGGQPAQEPHTINLRCLRTARH